MKLWTAWVDYGGTGEGRTLMAWIAYAESEADAIARFEKRFDRYSAGCAYFKEGVIENDVTRFLIPPTVFKQVRRLERRASYEFRTSLH